MKEPTIRIDVHGRCTHVYIFGTEISKGLTRVEFKANAGEKPEISLDGLSLCDLAEAVENAKSLEKLADLLDKKANSNKV